MTRQLIAAVTLSLSLAGMQSSALAQQTQAPVITGNVKGSCVMAPPAGNPGANAGDWTITCGDLDPGAGMTVIGSPSVESILVPVDVAPAPVPASEPATEPAAVDDPATDVTADAVAAESDTDGDGISDDYEINVYATDPGLWDTDGDGLSDGEELLTTGTDPFVWDTDGDGVSDGGIDAAAETEPLVADEGAAVVGEEGASGTASVDSDADRLADSDEAAFGTDPNNPDSDGDGYYDGDEVNLGTGPLDPASFPAE